MASGSKSFRRVLGSIKDSTKVGLATINSDYKVFIMHTTCVISEQIHQNLIPLYVDPFQAGTHMYILLSIVLQIIKAGSQIWRHEQSVVQDLDIAVVKATNHVECPPKEKHVRSELVIHSYVSSPLSFVRLLIRFRNVINLRVSYVALWLWTLPNSTDNFSPQQLRIT